MDYLKFSGLLAETCIDDGGCQIQVRRPPARPVKSAQDQIHWVIVYLLRRGEPSDIEMAHRLMAALVGGRQ
jgi:hypothetical protein